VQVKYTRSDGHVIRVRPQSLSLTKGKVMQIKRYTAAMIEWLAVYDATSDCCYYVPAQELGEGRRNMHLRLTPSRNGQRARIRYAEEYLTLEARQKKITPI
jgi:hypothetical protein